ncbi:MAG TPA: PH domain-containing protein, partial [Thermoanaerobaculia bacterium]|nr:PH domain-containing protein [Thermoanaerobaculia bacterium]
MPVITCPDCGRDVSTLATACPHCGRPSPAGTAPIVEQKPLAREQTLWKGTPSPVLLAGYLTTLVGVLVMIPLLTRFFAGSMDDQTKVDGMIRFGWIATAVITILQVVNFLIAWVRLRSTQYTVTNQRVLIEQGVFSKTVDEVDLRYVDDSQFTQTFVDRILGIGSVTLISSDKTSPRVVLRSIKDPRGVREIIRAEAYQTSQRQIFT